MIATQMVEVRINRFEVENIGKSSYLNIIVNQKLCDAGVPMVGRLFIHGVRHGRLSLYVDNARDEYVYEWTPDPEDEL